MKILLLGPDQRNEKIRTFLLNQGHDVLTFNERITIEFCHDNFVDWIISNGYAPIIKEPIISQYLHKILNLHPAYLPFGRGIYPNFWALFEGRPTGVSIHFIDLGIDTGNILYRRRVDPRREDTLQTFYDTLLRESEKLFIEHWEDIRENKVSPIMQDSLDTSVKYRNRLDSEKFMDLLTDRWDTTVLIVVQMGADFILGALFWEKYEANFK